MQFFKTVKRSAVSGPLFLFFTKSSNFKGTIPPLSGA